MDEDQDQSGSDKFAETLAAMSARYTTPEAKDIARKAFKELYNARGQTSTDEQTALNQLDTQAQAAKDALKAARDKIAAQRYNEQAKWFSIAGALGQGSKSGRFGEELGRLGNVLAEQSMAKQKFGVDQSQAVLENLLKERGIDNETVKAKLEALKARRTADNSLMNKSLDVLGREIRPGRGSGNSMSPFGKIAADEGLEPGTPAFTRRVQDLYNIDLKQKQQAAGLDVTDITPEDRQILAQQYGAPISPMDPFRGLSTKARQAAVQKSMDEGQKLIASTTDADNTARAAMRQIDRFMALNEKQASGPVYGIPGVGWLTGFSNAAQEMDTIRADMARKQRQPGEGQVSNFDAQQFLNATVGRGKGYPVNKNIGAALKAAKQLQLEQNEFLANYLAVNQHMQGAKEAWNRYLEANPIFDPKAKQGTYELNKQRTDYKSWFRGQMAPAEPLADPGDDDPTLQGLSPEERKAALTPALARGGQVRRKYAKGGKVDALKAAIEELMQRAKGAYTDASPVQLPPVPVNSALQRIGTDKEALLRSITGNPKVTPLDASQMQATNSVLDTVLANASKNTDANAGMRAEALWRQLQDMAAKYRTPQMGEGGKVSGLKALLQHLTNSGLSPNAVQKVEQAMHNHVARVDPGKNVDEIADKWLASGDDTNLMDLFESGNIEKFLRKDPSAIPLRRMAEGGGVNDKDRAATRSLIAQLAREIGQGATYNWSDELLSGGDPKRLRNERSALEEFGGDNPVTAAGLQMAGAVPVGMAVGAAGSKALEHMKGRAGRAAALASLLSRLVPKSAIGKMAVSGATSGAVAGAGAAQGDRLAGAGEGAVLGGTLGPLIGVGAKYGLGAGRRAWDFFSGNGPRAADEKVLGALANDTTNVQDVLARLKLDQKRRVPSMLGDSAGKNTAALMEAVAGKPGRGPGELAETLEQRQAGQGQRVEDQVNRHLKPSEYFAEEQKLKDELYTNAKPLYEKSYTTAKPIPVDDISYLYASNEGRKAMKQAVNLMNAEGIPITRKTLFGKNVTSLNQQTLDNTKRALDDMITKEEGSGANYTATNRGRVLRGMRDKLRDILDNNSPDYKAARQQYAGDLEVLDALRTGREKFNSLTPKQVENLVGGMSFAEKDAFRTGVAQTLFEGISKTPRGSNVAAKVVGTPALTEKLSQLFDSPKDAQAFNDALLREYNMFKSSQGAISNAARQRAGAAAAGLEDTPLHNAADMALDVGSQAAFLPGVAQNTGGPWTAARLMQWVRNKMPMSEQTANDVADTLKISDPKAAKDAIDRLVAEGERLKKRSEVSEAVRRAATRAGAVAIQPDPWAQEGQEDSQ